MELPTPNNADTPKQKKHREQIIVAGTLILVLLTFMMVVRRGQDSQPGDVTSDASGFSPSESGGGGGSDMGALPLMVGGIPGQVAAMQQGQFAALQKSLRRVTRRQDKLMERERKLQLTLNKDHPHAHRHPSGPTHHVPQSHHSPVHHKALISRHDRNPLHPPTHHGHRHHA